MFSFFGNATIASGNGSRLLANSTIYLANGTIVANGATALPFYTKLLVNAGTNGGNIAFLPVANLAIAANQPFATGYPAASGAELVIAPADITTATGCSTANANQVFVTASAATFANIYGI